MNITISQNKTEYFLNNYFKHLWFKLFIIQEILWILYCYIQHCYLLISILLSFLLIPISFITPKLLHKENRKFIAQFYDKNNGEFNSKKDNKAITVICNLKKFNGPTFGALTLNSNSLIFVPFKENLNNEKFIIDDIKNPNVHISVIDLQHSWINKAFFKGNLYCLDLNLNGKKVVLQMPKYESTKIQALFRY
ncbi:hypothetical protein [Clostridium tagluense]|uniref:Uncharacterized protein n=1 Tax=Clostridium tagluense TaxID=360422 RepID=A0A401UPQ1_9CLOT|nr:hypothetical protein [Clostridium tagluense]GCD11525.1 hypothetical protein Ctaglu_31480 [Clostridium tagluense]